MTAKAEITNEQWAAMRDDLLASTKRIPSSVMNGSIQEAQRWKEAAKKAYSLANSKRPNWNSCAQVLETMRSFAA